MMTKSTSKTRALLITVAFVPLFAVAIFIFSTKVYAQKSATEIKPKGVVSNKEGASKEMLEEFNMIIRKHLKEISNSKNGYSILENINENIADKERIRVIFNSMSKKQQIAQNVKVRRTSDHLPPSIVPTEKEFENFKDPKKFGVWIDDKKVKNSELYKYKASDFGLFYISNLYGGAKFDRQGKRLIYKYQLDILTTNYYEKYKKETLASTEQRYFVSNWKKLKAEMMSK